MEWEREILAKRGAIITAIMSVVAALIAFGIINWSDAQVGAFQAMLIAVVPLVLNAAMIVASGRRDVTPVDDPRDRDGTPLVPAMPVINTKAGDGP